MKHVQTFSYDIEGFLKIISMYDKVFALCASKDLALTVLSKDEIKTGKLKNVAYIVAYCVKEGKENTLYIFNALSRKCFKYEPPKGFEHRLFHRSFTPVVGGIRCVSEVLR